MATQRCKTEKIDLNPTRVQNPFEHLKRSPGKFDQKVYMEQELSSSNNVRFYKHLYNTQQQAQLNSYDKSITELRKRNTELRAQNEEYTYLRTLRTALHKEKLKRQRETKTARPVTPEEVRRRLSIERRKTMLAVSEQKTESNAAVMTETTGQPKLNDNVQPATDNVENKDNFEQQAEDEDGSETSVTNSSIDEKLRLQRRKNPPRKKRPVSSSRLATLESLSYEIMTNTLPIGKMKRILPEEQLPVQEKWPILSNYRKQTVLPSVKATKQQLTEDMGSLHTRINKYFGCDNFPLWQYKYVAKDYPTKYKLLKAIETEGIHLPTLPKH